MNGEEPSYRISFIYRKILVPVDGSEVSLKALELAIDLAKHYGSKITVVTVKSKGETLSQDPLAKAKARIAREPINVSYKTLEYDPSLESVSYRLIKEIVEEGYDLVIMGARGKTLYGELPIGSVALSLVINAPISVLVVR
ncbi:universal stress protein [Thermosphaera chiliense]|uniref:Universal stress protein n=1 Tax=Thermosphaera chiliense TaxID=3402707 RepID=A0A7M1UPM6_9CREN|nr:universal stress protein [Thermosphaera aggregans]QOR94190.1 universal stress protein [Thermosphaera aggregans]